MRKMNSSNLNSLDDKDLDDAALWAIIDAAAASYSSTKHRGTVAVKFPNYQSPPTPVSYPSPPQNSKNTHQIYRYAPPSAQHYGGPQKKARSCASEVSESGPLALVQRTAPAASLPLVYKLPEAYLSPGIGSFSAKSDCGSEVLPGSCGKRGEEGIMRHSNSTEINLTWSNSY